MWEGESGEFVHHFAESAYWGRPCPGYHGKGLCWRWHDHAQDSTD